ncbi:MAG: hypothetical protein IJJ26_06330, partial [Victivallales bacterium]|nr:hypothetical protein [Victivallales bacterium]
MKKNTTTLVIAAIAAIGIFGTNTAKANDTSYTLHVISDVLETIADIVDIATPEPVVVAPVATAPVCYTQPTPIYYTPAP